MGGTPAVRFALHSVMSRKLRALGRTLLGWGLVAAGLVALVLPGPGLLLLLSGLIVLSRQYEWARRALEPVRIKAFRVARASVDNWWQMALSLLGALCLVVAGMVWWADPEIPRLWKFGPHLPAAGWGTGLGLIVSGLVALGLIAYSFITFRIRGEELPRPTASTSPRATAPANIDDPP
jgi:hypothetical protein